MKYSIQRLLALAAVISVLTACGGGGGGGSDSGSSSNATQQSVPSPTVVQGLNGTGAASAGELVWFGVSADRTRYEYRILQSEYGLAGTVRTGTLTDNGDGTYTPSGAPETNVVIFENGLILGFIKEAINGTPRVYPTLVSTTAAITLAALNDSYAYAGTACTPAGCGQFFGSLKAADGVVEACPGQDFSPNCTDKITVTLNKTSEGLFQMSRNGLSAGTLTSLLNGSQKVVIADLADYRNGGLGRGMLLAVRQTRQLAGAFDGDYLSLGYFSSGVRFASAIRVAGSNYIDYTVTDTGLKGKTTGSLTFNTPFNGTTIAKPSGGNPVAVVGGEGLFVAVTDSSFEFGIKIPNADAVKAIQ